MAAFHVISPDIVQYCKRDIKLFRSSEICSAETTITTEISVKINNKLTVGPHWFSNDWLTKDRPMADVNDRRDGVDWFGMLPLPTSVPL